MNANDKAGRALLARLNWATEQYPLVTVGILAGVGVDGGNALLFGTGVDGGTVSAPHGAVKLVQHHGDGLQVTNEALAFIAIAALSNTFMNSPREQWEEDAASIVIEAIERATRALEHDPRKPENSHESPNG